ncbi:FecR family protein [Bradyrhizobium japonicum]|uniref:FecR family protein n=1 Tax=Bradyrhizobium japonicum TaxID=375 RepID=UPI001BAA2289|nr:FecR domain-containing protein [Bradyrhizobium japonicum]MBR0956586.1 FecR domain-containing protein [Bradyrhizobium japonicum]
MNDGEKPTALDEAAEWYVRQDAGVLDAGEQARFRAWLMQPANRAAYEKVAGTWDDLGRIPRPGLSTGLPQQGDVRTVPLRRHPSRTSRPRRWALAAAAVVVAVTAGYALDLPMRLEADAMTATGEARIVTLDDGSSVALNTASAIAVDYSRERRRIRLLRGEAVFTVAKDAARPFVVAAASGEAVARGTVFAVRKDDEAATVTVLESHVGVSYPAAGRTAVELAPGEALDYSRRGLGVVRAVDADAATAWRRGKLIFVDRPLGEVIAELNRYHSGRIQIIDGSIGSHPVSGVFDTKNPLQALEVIEQTLGLHSTRLSSLLILLHH